MTLPGEPAENVQEPPTEEKVRRWQAKKYPPSGRSILLDWFVRAAVSTHEKFQEDAEPGGDSV